MKGVPELREFHIVPGNVIESAFCRPRVVAESRSVTRLWPVIFTLKKNR